ncbi:serine hydrolase [Mucilaginibacter sp. 21P]|nr:serine hydrolase [Mucilaginibacter sp. 21P]
MFHVASLSKVIFALVVLKLAEQSIISLDERLPLCPARMELKLATTPGTKI